MKKILLSAIAMIAFVAMSLPAQAQGYLGDLLYFFDNGVLSITGDGSMPDFSETDHAPWYDYKGEIAEVLIGDDVSNIGNYAFAGCSSLETLTFGWNSQLTSIGSHAFEDSSVSIDFRECPNLEAIGDYAFANCTSFSNLGDCSNLKSIGNHAFEWCEGDDRFVIPSSLTSFGADVFYGNNKFSEFEGGNDYFCTKDGVLYSKDENTLVAYPYGKQDISNYAIPNGVETISDAAFHGSQLTGVSIPASVSTIGNQAFADCSELSEIKNFSVVPQNISGDVFDNVSTSCTLIVPKASDGAYETAYGWKEFFKAGNLITGIESIDAEGEEAPVNIYNMQGALVRKQVLGSDATSGLYPGIYLVGGKKVVVK